MDSRRHPDEPTRPRQLGPWRLVRRISAGGMATVHLARGASGQAALKILHEGEDPQARLRLAREQELLASITHAAVVRLAPGPQGTTWTALTLLHGPTLGEALRDGARFPDQAVPWLDRLADGLAELHAKGWSHGDLKPDNVVLTADGPVLIDLGHAEPADGQQQGSDPSGSFVWCPPERLPHRFVDGRRADVYGLGALLFALHTGRAPRPGESAHPSVPRSLQPLLQASLAPDPYTRPANARAFQRGLRRRPMSDRAAWILAHVAVAAAILLTLASAWVEPPSPHAPQVEARAPERPRAAIAPRITTPPLAPIGLAAALRTPMPSRASHLTARRTEPPGTSATTCTAEQARLDLVGEASSFVHGLVDDPSGPVLPLSGCLPTGRPLTLRGAPKGDRVLNVGRVTLAAGATTRLTCSELLGHCRALETS